MPALCGREAEAEGGEAAHGRLRLGLVDVEPHDKVGPPFAGAQLHTVHQLLDQEDAQPARAFFQQLFIYGGAGHRGQLRHIPPLVDHANRQPVAQLELVGISDWNARKYLTAHRPSPNVGYNPHDGQVESRIGCEHFRKITDCGRFVGALRHGDSQPVGLMDMISTLERALGRDAIKIMKPMQPGDVTATYADVSKLNALTGYAPKVDLAEGLERFVAWYRDYYRM